MHDSLFIQNRDVLHSLINEHSEIGIVIGEPHNTDTIAASLALYLSLYAVGKDVQVVSKAEPIVEFSHLFGIDKIGKEFRGAVKVFTISLPYRDGEIEKVSYKIENDRLNINLFAGEKKVSFSEREIQYVRKGAVPSLIFAIGIPSVDHVHHFLDASIDSRIINIDNHLENSGYGDIVYTGSYFSSVSEIVARIMKDLSLVMDMDTAQNLLDGILYATDNFSSELTSPHAFEAASYLLKHGAKRRPLEKKTTSITHQDILSQSRRLSESRKTIVQDTNSIPKDYILEDTYQDTSAAEGQEISDVDLDQVPKDWFTPKVFRSSSKHKTSS